MSVLFVVVNEYAFMCILSHLSSEISYRVVLIPSRKMSAASTTANAWVCVAGSLGQTPQIPVHKTHHNQFTFQVRTIILISCYLFTKGFRLKSVLYNVMIIELYLFNSLCTCGRFINHVFNCYQRASLSVCSKLNHTGVTIGLLTFDVRVATFLGLLLVVIFAKN